MRVALEMTSGRTMLSIQLTSTRPTAAGRCRDHMSPVTSIQIARLPHTSGAPNGISAISTVTAPISTGALTPKIQ